MGIQQNKLHEFDEDLAADDAVFIWRVEMGVLHGLPDDDEAENVFHVLATDAISAIVIATDLQRHALSTCEKYQGRTPLVTCLSYVDYVYADGAKIEYIKRSDLKKIKQ